MRRAVASACIIFYFFEATVGMTRHRIVTTLAHARFTFHHFTPRSSSSLPAAAVVRRPEQLEIGDE